MRQPCAILITLLGFAGTGCNLPSPALSGLTPPPPADDAERITLHVPLNAAVKRDDKSGAEGVRVHFYFWTSRQRPPVLVPGSMRFLLFDGDVPPAQTADARPLHVWALSHQELEQYVGRDHYGLWGYSLSLLWGRDRPTKGKVTLVGVYESPDGRELPSVPTIIVLGPS